MSPTSNSDFNNQHRHQSNSISSSSTTELRREIQQELTGLRTAQRELNQRREHIVNLLNQLDLEEQPESDSDTFHSTSSQHHYTESTSAYRPSYAASASNTRSRSNRRQEHHRSTTPPPEYDSSIERISGICAIGDTTPSNFPTDPPFKVGDIVEITNNYKNQKGFQGVVDNNSCTFCYFSFDKASFQRQPQNLKRIHISKYRPREQYYSKKPRPTYN